VYRGVGAKERRARAVEALRQVKLEPRMHHKPTELSGGQRQRVAIARALVLQPEVLLLDEPTTGLDREAGAQVNDALALVREQGLAVILISHDYHALGKLADRVVQVKDRKVGYCGPAKDFLKREMTNG